MGIISVVRRAALALCVVLAGLAFAAGSAGASTIYLCVEEKAEGAVKSGGTTGGSCKTGYDQVALPAEEKEQKKLIEVLPYLKFEEKGIDSKPTIRVSGANVQLVSGAGKEHETNGEGNLVVGYDETPGEQTGSNNLVLGSEQKYTSYGAILGGSKNHSTGPSEDLFGHDNTASSEWTSVSGGEENRVELLASSVSGGIGNLACSPYASVSGGAGNEACAENSSISGGEHNRVSGAGSSISGGTENKATEGDASIVGGNSNTASRPFATVAGGRKNRALEEGASVDGGELNTAEGRFSSILGGKEITLKEAFSTSP